MTGEYALFRSICARLPPDWPFERFVVFLASWEIVPVIDCGETIGAVMIRENEIHIGLDRVPRASARAVIRKTLARVIEERGYAMTAVSTDNPRGIEFCKRLGFTVIASVDGAIHLRCERATHV